MDRQDDRFLWFTLQNGVTAPNDGAWTRLKGRHPVHVTIEGTFAASARILGSNNPNQPLDSFNDAPVVDGVTHGGPTTVKVDTPYEWIKVQVTAYTSGALSAFVRSGQGPDSC